MADVRIALIRNENVSLVGEAQKDVGVPLGGEFESGFIHGIETPQKQNAKASFKRVKVIQYNSKTDNLPTPDKNPFDPTIKAKNDLARESIIPLLNSNSRSDGIRLDSIQLEISQDVVKEKAKPIPDEKKLQLFQDQLSRIEIVKRLNLKREEGIKFKN